MLMAFLLGSEVSGIIKPILVISYFHCRLLTAATHSVIVELA